MICGKKIDLETYNIPYENKIKTWQLYNDYVNFNVHHFNDCQHFIDYILFWFPQGYFHKKDITRNPYYINILRENRQIDISLETVYRCIKKDNQSINLIVEMFKYLCGFNDDITNKLSEHINNFDNWDYEDWILFVAEKCV